MSEVTIRRTPNDSGDLVGAVEASEILGVERTRIARYVKTGVMPEPIATLRATKIWLRSDVEAFAKKRVEDARIKRAKAEARKAKKAAAN